MIIPTTGCGSTNTITGILDAWQDSHKVIVISGQVNKKDTTYLKKVPLRKLGVQEANIVDIVRPITKYATLIENAEDSYTDYPKQASENAKIALRWAEENGWGSCGTDVGKQRANQLAKNEPISRDTIARMACN